MKNSGRKKLYWTLGLLLLVLVGQRIYFRTTDDFRFANITYNLPYHPEWDHAPLSTEDMQQLETILNQPFSYIGKGAQSYAFESADGQYVIKFFKFKHLRVGWREHIIPPFAMFNEIKQRRIARKNKLIKSVFTGHKLAFDVNKEGTGLIFLHLNPTKNLNRNITLYDKLGIKRVMPLDPTIFVVQKKCKTTRAVINETLAEGNLDLAKQRITRLLDFHLSEYQKGIYDRDHGVKHNTGFIGEQPIRLDVGKLTEQESMKQLEVYGPDLIKIAYKLETWLREQHPQAHADLSSHIEAYMTDCLGREFCFKKETLEIK